MNYFYLILIYYCLFGFKKFADGRRRIQKRSKYITNYAIECTYYTQNEIEEIMYEFYIFPLVTKSNMLDEFFKQKDVHSNE